MTNNTYAEDENTWHLDSGCSDDMCGKKELVSSLDEFVKSSMKFGNNTGILILGKCRISIRLKDSSHSSIFDVFYDPSLHHNLLSVEQLLDKGYSMQIYQGHCTMYDKNDRFIAKVKMIPNRLFPLKIQHEKFFYLSSAIPDENWLWHTCFGHYHFSRLNYLSRK